MLLFSVLCYFCSCYSHLFYYLHVACQAWGARQRTRWNSNNNTIYWFCLGMFLFTARLLMPLGVWWTHSLHTIIIKRHACIQYMCVCVCMDTVPWRVLSSLIPWFINSNKHTVLHHFMECVYGDKKWHISWTQISKGLLSSLFKVLLSTFISIMLTRY